MNLEPFPNLSVYNFPISNDAADSGDPIGEIEDPSIFTTLPFNRQNTNAIIDNLQGFINHYNEQIFTINERVSEIENQLNKLVD